MDSDLFELLTDDLSTGLALIEDSGVYQLLIEIPTKREFRIGELGTVRVPGGCYLYTGSARRGLAARLRRHLRERKPLRWHIDYLLLVGRVMAIRAFPMYQIGECDLNEKWSMRSEVPFPIPGFGSSDCRCCSHLVRLPSLDIWFSTAGHSELDGSAVIIDACDRP